MGEFWTVFASDFANPTYWNSYWKNNRKYFLHSSLLSKISITFRVIKETNFQHFRSQFSETLGTETKREKAQEEPTNSFLPYSTVPF